MNVKLVAVAIFLGCFVAVSAQRSLKDSFIRALTKVQPDTVRQKLYNDLGKLYLPKWRTNKGDLDSAFYYFRKSVYLVDSSNRNNNTITNESLSLLGETYLRAGNLSLGQQIFLQAITNYHKAADKTREAEAWNELGLVMAYIEPGVAYSQPCFDNALSLFTQTGNITRKIDVLLGMAEVHVRKGMSALAEKEVVNLLKEAKEKRAYNVGDLYLYLAYLNRYEGKLADALAYALAAEKNLRGNTDAYREPEIYWELALEYDELDQPENSIYWFKKCIEVRENQKASQYVIYRTYYLMVVQMIKAGHEKQALEILQNAEKKNPPGAPTITAILCQSLAYCFNAEGRFALAEKNFLAMIRAYNEDVQDTEILLIAYYDISKFYVDHSHFDKAEPYLKEAFRISNNTTIGRLKDLHLLRFKIDSANGNYKAAIEEFQEYKNLNDSIFNEAKSKQIAELNIKYDVNKKEQNLTILQKETLVQQKDLRQARLTRNYILAGVVLLLLIVGLLYNRYQLKQRANNQLKASQDKIEKQNVSLQHLVSEKEWLLKEIHHRVKNNLHTISGLLDAQAGYLKTAEALLAINDSQHRVQAMSLLHQKLFNSESLSMVEMPEYIHELVGYLEHSFGIQQKVNFSLDIDNLQLELSYALPIGLILNEAITNAIKHAFTGKEDATIIVRLKRQPFNQCFLLIADTGRGLPADFNSKQSHSMGMSLMQGLTEDINGAFSIRNNNGTEINISFALDFPAGDNPSFHSYLSQQS